MLLTWGIRLLIVLLSVGAAVSVSEWLYRHHLLTRHLEKLDALEPGNWKALPGDPRQFSLHANHRGSGAFLLQRERRFFYRTNPDSLRGPPVSPKQSIPRALALGDSYTFGWAVEEPETYPAQLEARLRQIGCQAEVINGGIPGYNTEQEYHLLTDLLPRYDPDLVLLGYVMNDAEPQHNVPPAPNVVYRYARSWLWERLKQPLYEHLLIDVLRPNLHLHSKNYLEGFEPDSPKWRESAAALRRIAQLCAEAETPLMLVIFPDFTKSFESYPYETIHEQVASWGRELSLPVLDLLSVFRGRHSGEYQVDGDGHPNALAYRKIARLLARTLLETRHLPCSPAPHPERNGPPGAPEMPAL